MNISFEKISEKHQKDIMKIYNYYVENSTAAFPSNPMPEQFYGFLLQRCEGYPAYAVIDSDTGCVVGFCMLSAYLPLQTFTKSACLTYFIAPEYTGKGIGGECLQKLESEAKQMGITQLISDISSENNVSISFHKKHGFVLAGELSDIGEKLGRSFGIVYMQKKL